VIGSFSSTWKKMNKGKNKVLFKLKRGGHQTALFYVVLKFTKETPPTNCPTQPSPA
jgi:hypothetical protein